MKILVTGATGFVGKHLVKKLRELDYNILISLLTDEASPFDSNVYTHVFDYNTIENDITILKSHSIDGVIHLASLYLTAHKPVQASKLIESNLKFGTHILEAAVQANVKWFINTGTFWQHYNNSNYSPVNLYAATKQAFESIAQYYIDTNQIMFNTIKLSDTFGSNDSRPKIFNIWQQAIMTGETVDMSPGDQLIDICYIEDIINAYALLIKHLEDCNLNIKNGEVFAVNAEKRYTLKAIANLYEQVSGRTINIRWGKRPYKQREVMIPWIDGKVVPGWKPSISIEDGIKKLLTS